MRKVWSLCLSGTSEGIASKTLFKMRILSSFTDFRVALNQFGSKRVKFRFDLRPSFLTIFLHQNCLYPYNYGQWEPKQFN